MLVVTAPSRLTMWGWEPRWDIIFSSDMRLFRTSLLVKGFSVFTATTVWSSCPFIPEQNVVQNIFFNLLKIFVENISPSSELQIFPPYKAWKNNFTFGWQWYLLKILVENISPSWELQIFPPYKAWQNNFTLGWLLRLYNETDSL